MDLQRTISVLNRQTLYAVQAVAHADRSRALVSFALTEPLLTAIMDLDMQEIERVSDSGTLLFSPRCSAEVIASLKHTLCRQDRVMLASLSATPVPTTICAEV